MLGIGNSLLRSGAAGATSPQSGPRIESATLAADGESLTLVFDVAVTAGNDTGGTRVWKVGGYSDAATANYDSGSGTTTLLFTLSKTFLAGDNLKVGYTQPGDGFTDGTDLLASFSGKNAVNNSVITPPPTFITLPSVTGGTLAGDTLTRSLGTATYQGVITGEWVKNGTPTGVTTETYSDTDWDDTILWRSVATNPFGTDTADSNLFVVDTKPPPYFTTNPTISGDLAAGSTLTRDVGSAVAADTITGEWAKNGFGTGVTTATYSDTVMGDTIVWISVATNEKGSAEAVSNAIQVETGASMLVTVNIVDYADELRRMVLTPVGGGAAKSFTLALGDNSHEFTGLDWNTEYVLTVFRVDSEANEVLDITENVFTPPEFNVSLAAAAVGESVIQLTLTEPDPLPHGGYELQISTDGSSWSDWDSLPTGTATYDAEELPPSTTRYFRARSVNYNPAPHDDAVTPWSTPASATTDADTTAPTLVSATVRGPQLTLVWSEPATGSGAYLAQFNLDLSATGSDIVVSTHVSGNGTATWVLTLATAAVYDDVANLDYLGGAGLVQDAAGNSVAPIVDAPVANTTPSGAVVLDYRYALSSWDTAASFSAPDAPIGEAGDREHVIVSALSRSTAVGATCTGVTIGGVVATKIDEYNVDHGTASAAASFWHAVVPTGTTATVVATFNQAMSGCSMGMWTAKNISSFTPFDTGSFTNPDSSQNVDVSLDTPAGSSAVMAVAFCKNGGVAWTGLDEHWDVTVATAFTHSGASKVFTTAGPQTIYADPAAGGRAAQHGFSICLK